MVEYFVGLSEARGGGQGEVPERTAGVQGEAAKDGAILMTKHK